MRFDVTDPALRAYLSTRQRAEAFLAVLDPAWKSDSGGGGKGANAQYALESGRNMAGQIRTSGVWPMEGDALAWVWATTLSIVSGETHEFIARLGLRPCATFVWVKTEGEADDDHFRLRRVPGIARESCVSRTQPRARWQHRCRLRRVAFNSVGRSQRSRDQTAARRARRERARVCEVVAVSVVAQRHERARLSR